MKFTVTALLAALATTSFAQNATIVSPSNDSSAIAGQNLEMEIRYDTPLLVSLYTAGFFYETALKMIL